MSNIIISAWNSESKATALSLQCLSYDNIHICVSSQRSLKLLEELSIRNVHLHHIDYPLYKESIILPSHQFLCSRREAFEHFAQNITSLLQADRLQLGNLGLTETYVRAQSVFFYWINFLEKNHITKCFFPITPHTLSDHLLLQAADFLSINGYVCRHCHDCNLFTKLLDTRLNPIEDVGQSHLITEFGPLQVSISKIALEIYLSPYLNKDKNPYLRDHVPNHISDLRKGDVSGFADAVIKYRELLATIQPLKLVQNKIVYYMHIEPEMTLNPSSFPFLTQLSALYYLSSTFESQPICLKEHPHIHSYLYGQYGPQYSKYRRLIYPLLQGLSPSHYYLGTHYSNSTLLASNIVPASVTGDICMEASLLGFNSIMCSNWWGLTDFDCLGIYSPEKFKSNGIHQSRDIPNTSLIAERLTSFMQLIKSRTSFCQVMYNTAYTKAEFGWFISDHEDLINRQTVALLNSRL